MMQRRAWIVLLGALACSRGHEPSFVELPNGKISARASIEVANDSDSPRRYRIALVDARDATLRSIETLQVAARDTTSVPLVIDVSRESFVDGTRTVYVRVDDSSGFERIRTVQLAGPRDRAAPAPGLAPRAPGA